MSNRRKTFGPRIRHNTQLPAANLKFFSRGMILVIRTLPQHPQMGIRITQSPNLVCRSGPETDAELFLQYQRAKSNWRKHMRKPTRKARKFIKRNGKGRGKGKSRFNFLGVMSDQEYSQIFYGGRPFVRRTSGKGKGRHKNRRGSD